MPNVIGAHRFFAARSGDRRTSHDEISDSQERFPSSPAEKAATAELNRNMLAANAAEGARSKGLELQYLERIRQQASQYEEQKKRWEQQQQQYLALLTER